MSRKNIFHLSNRALSVSLVFLFATIGLQADTIVYNSFGPGLTITPEGDTGTFTVGPPGTTNYMGAPFVPITTVDLTSLTGNWAAGLNAEFPLTTTSGITISIWSGSSSEPGTELESWSLTVDEEANNYTVTSTTNPKLIAGDTYWVLEGYTDGVDNNNFLGWGLYSGATTLGLWESDISPTTLAVFTGTEPALEVRGTPAAATVPEPSALLLMTAGALCVFARSIRRRSN